MPMHADDRLPEVRDCTPAAAFRGPSGSKLQRAFTRALSVAFASSLGVWGCAAETGRRGDPDSEELRGPVCLDGIKPFPLEGVEPARPVDYVSVRQITYAGPAGVFDRGHDGEPCATATDFAACERALLATADGLSLSETCGMIGACRNYLVSTSGDEVKRYASRTEILQFLGAIDSEGDALVLLDYDGITTYCDNGARLVETERGFELTSRDQVQTCPPKFDLVTRLVKSDGHVQELTRKRQPEEQTGQCVIPGRRPEGLCNEARSSANAELGAYFASMAHFEAASVAAFEILALELAQHGAPPELVDRARLAARDELRHAALTAAQAHRFGARPVAPKVERRPVRSLEAIALDNATEGAVRETYAALLACHQAKAACDPAIAGMMRQIAGDEIAHATLSFDIHAWLQTRLDDAARARVTAAHVLAVQALERDCEAEPNAVQRELAGVPTAAVAREMCRVLTEQLWLT